jgi:cytochrome c oxidase cbb3-type subunit 3
MPSRCRKPTSGAPRVLGALAVALCVLPACEREHRRFDEPPSETALATVRETDLQPGAVTRGVTVRGPYEENAWAVSEGKRLFNAYNCVGCHANGGGGMGPPLMDSTWIYGSEPANIVQTILGGRPNGMPAFGGKMPETQAWQLAAYVRSMSGLLRKDVEGGRSDHMQGPVQEQSRPRETPKQSSLPPAAQTP